MYQNKCLIKTQRRKQQLLRSKLQSRSAQEEAAPTSLKEECGCIIVQVSGDFLVTILVILFINSNTLMREGLKKHKVYGFCHNASALLFSTIVMCGENVRFDRPFFTKPHDKFINFMPSLEPFPWLGWEPTESLQARCSPSGQKTCQFFPPWSGVFIFVHHGQGLYDLNIRFSIFPFFLFSFFSALRYSIAVSKTTSTKGYI